MNIAMNSACHLKAIVLFLGLVTVFPNAISSESAPDTLEQKWGSAIANDRVEQLEQLLDQYIDKRGEPLALLHAVAPNGKSALMVASKQGELGLVKRLVALGADVNELTKTGGTPFMFAVLGNHLEVARWLHNAGANVNAKGSNGWSAATIAGAKGQTDMLRWLVEIDADINAPDVYRFTPLMRAVDNRHAESVRILLEQGGADVQFKDESENTALHFAVANKQSAVIKLLMQHGANPLQTNRDGITPADLAEQHPTISTLLTEEQKH